MLANFISKFYKNAVFKPLRTAFFAIDRKFIKFIFVGILNTLFSYFLYSLFVYMGLIPNIALFLQYIFGVLWNFKTTGVLVFNNHENKRIFKFILCYIFTFSINSLFLYLLAEKIKLNEYLSQAILIPPIALTSFILLKYWVFKKSY